MTTRFKTALAAITGAALLTLAPVSARADDERMAMIDAAIAAGDADKGARVFRQCQACHVVDSEQNKVGPHLVGIMGRAWGSVDGFRYSGDLESVGGVGTDEVKHWNIEDLTTYLTNPKDLVPRGRMAFRGLRKEEDVANVIAYLAQATKDSLAAE